jgi:cytochrome c-type biogenesis protein CcmH/NrfG
MTDPKSELILDTQEVDQQVHKVLEAKLAEELTKVKREVKNHFQPLNWVISSMLFVILCLNSFTAYQQWQQSQQLNQLSRRLTASQVNPSR